MALTERHRIVVKAFRARFELWSTKSEPAYAGETNFVKHSHSTFWLVIAGLSVAVLSGVTPANGSVNVTQHHNHASRDGLYIDSAFTPAAAAKLTRDLNFDGTISGDVYAQPLYIEGGPGGRRWSLQ